MSAVPGLSWGRLLPWSASSTSYRVPVAVGDIVEDVSCGGCTPRPVRVVRLYPWGLRVAPLYRLTGEFDYDCTRWRRLPSEPESPGDRQQEEG